MCIFSKCCRCSELPVIWIDKIPVKKRFELVLGDEAVLDKETGLVWQRSPGQDTFNWNSAIVHCRHQVIGGRMGWRLPTFEELISLVDADQSPSVLPPVGHPFNLGSGIQTFWVATLAPYNLRNDVNAGMDGVAYTVHTSGLHYDQEHVSNDMRVWCVRGGFNSSI